jgi:fucose permease
MGGAAPTRGRHWSSTGGRVTLGNVVSAAAPHTQRRSRNTLTLTLASLGFVSLGLPEGMLGVAWPSIRAAFDLPLDALGLLLATFASGYVLASALSGRMLGRWGIGSVLATSCGMTGLSLLGYAVAPAWSTMVALGAVLGVGAGTIDAGLNTFAAVLHGPRVLNWMHAAFGLGAAVGPLVMTTILSAGWAWNVGYVIVAAAQLGLAAGYVATRQRYGGVTPQAESVHPLTAPPPPGTGASARELLRNPLTWLSLGLFFVYAGIEAAAGQWSFSLLTVARGTPTTIAGVLVSAYWGALTLGRVLFGVIVTHMSVDTLLRSCMGVAVGAAGLVWLNVPGVSSIALVVLGLALAPIFPSLIAKTPGRLGSTQTANAVGLQVAAAVLGGAAIPAAVGVLAARLSLEVVGACLLAAGLAQLGLHEALVRRAFGPPRNARSRSDAAASFPPGA